MFTASEQLLYKEAANLALKVEQIMTMNLLLVIILYLQLLQQQEAAPFDDRGEME